MRIVFFGSGEFGIPTLKQLAVSHTVSLVVSQPDRPAGRHRKLTPTPVAAWAEENKLPVLKAQDANADDVLAKIAATRPDAAVVIAFGQKLGEKLIAAMGGLVVNLHASLLPRYRGAAPINWAIINGEQETGVSVISLAQKMDAGLIYARQATPIDPLETAGELHDRLALMGPGLIEQVLSKHAAGTLVGQAQDESKATRAPKLSKSDSHVSFCETAAHLCRRVHGLTPWPGARVVWHSFAGAGKQTPLILLRVRAVADMTFEAPPGTVIDDGRRVAVRDGVVELLEVQTPGGRPMKIDEFLNGHRIACNDKLVGDTGVTV